MSGNSLYRLLGCFNQAGIKLNASTRPNIVGHLSEGFDTDAGRIEWLRQAIFAVLFRPVENRGAYIKSLADAKVHEVLGEQEMAAYNRQRAAGFGDSRWTLTGCSEELQ